MPALLPTALAALFPLLLIVAALKDLTSYTIPNWLSLALAAAFAALCLTTRAPLPMVGVHVLAGLGALAVGMALFGLGWIGGGDAKLLAAACLWFGWPDAQAFLLDTTLAGGAFAFLLLVARGEFARPLVQAREGWIGRLVRPGEPAPYGVAIAIGALVAFPASQVLRFVHTSC